MKQYKHKQTGNIWQKSANGKTYTSTNFQSYRIPSAIVENSQDWEEIVEKNYEIISIRSSGGKIWKKSKDSDFIFFDPNGSAWVYLNNFEENCGIYSVKRLSDGEIFTIGDLVDFNSFGKKELLINYIEKNATNDEIGLYDLKGYKTCLSVAKKSKQLLFTSEDGKEIFYGDTIYPVTDDFELLITTHASETDIGIRCFSTQDKANEYVLMNKPCLSIKDITYGVNGCSAPKAFVDNELMEFFKEIVKTKI
jgi:hypothetical protein